MVKCNGVMYAYVHNLQGDIVAILDNTGAKVVEYKYDAWGKPLDVVGSMASSLGVLNPFRYREYVFDPETELYYLRSRYYNHKCGCFVNGDSSICFECIGANIFAYCSNNPIVYFDETGCSEDYYFYHSLVQADIQKQFLIGYGFIVNTEEIAYNVPNEKEGLPPYTGRVDLFVVNTGEIYEVKKATLSYDRAVNQVARYLKGGYRKGLPRPKRGGFYPILCGTIVGNDYMIEYWFAGKGTIMYNILNANGEVPDLNSTAEKALDVSKAKGKKYIARSNVLNYITSIGRSVLDSLSSINSGTSSSIVVLGGVAIGVGGAGLATMRQWTK